MHSLKATLQSTLLMLEHLALMVSLGLLALTYACMNASNTMLRFDIEILGVDAGTTQASRDAEAGTLRRYVDASANERHCDSFEAFVKKTLSADALPPLTEVGEAAYTRGYVTGYNATMSDWVCAPK